MKRFKVILEGHGFYINLNGKNEPVGFFSTFIVSVKSLKDVRSNVAPLLLKRLDQNNIGIVNNLLLIPYAIIEAIYLLEDDESTENVNGFTFYKESFFSGIKCSIYFMYLKFFNNEKLILINSQENSINL